jgi:hypothetical protein
MKATCPTHGEVEFRVDKNHNAWCIQCRNDAVREFISTDEGKAKIAQAMRDAMLPPFGRGTITSHKPGTPGFVPLPPRPFGEVAGIEPPYSDTHIRYVRVTEGSEDDDSA